MGRKSLAGERREQILDAFAVCLRQYGFEGCTLERVAAAAGVQRSIIRHYIGNRDDLVSAAVDRIIAGYKTELAQAIANLPQSELVPALLDYLYCQDDGHELLAAYDTLVNSLWATHERDPHTQALLLNLHLEWENLISEALAHAYPQATPASRQGTAYALMCLANDTWSMVSLGFPQTRFSTARRSAEILINHLAEEKQEAKVTN